TMVEALAPTIEKLTKGKVYLRILSNYADRSLARAKCVIPPKLLESNGFTGEEVRDGGINAYEFAASDPYRAVTHNKGSMNGIDRGAMATGHDRRALEAAAHAYGTRFGRQGPRSTWSIRQGGSLVEQVHLPMSEGTGGGATRAHAMSKWSYTILQVQR